MRIAITGAATNAKRVDPVAIANHSQARPIDVLTSALNQKTIDQQAPASANSEPPEAAPVENLPGSSRSAFLTIATIACDTIAAGVAAATPTDSDSRPNTAAHAPRD